ncbi:MAG: N-acetylneuraminate synthase [Xanthobacteraceae bacterium]|nr:N-acetylneuraminate synthase [Xanthobacteraceae bacterium]
MTGVTVIAEAGVNHNGRLDLALLLVDAAADAGADIVKFQTFRADELATRSAKQADYQARNIGHAQSQHAMLKALELNDEAHRRLLDHCRSRNIGFLSTPFDEISLKLLVDGLGVEQLKVGSGDITNAPLLLSMAGTGRSVILSTGMATLDEVEEALGVLALGYVGTPRPSRAAFQAAFTSIAGQQALRRNVALLHCTSDYPAPDDEINLRAIDALAERFGLPVGLSDHSVGISVPIAAVARGATIIEKHLTLDRTMQGPDHKASVEPPELKAMVAGIRQVERALGPGGKVPTQSELKTMPVARKSIVARKPIGVGEPFCRENLAIKRPGTGHPPTLFWDVIGCRATRAYDTDDLIAEPLGDNQADQKD